MLSFLNSVVLPLLLAGLIPLIIHLFSRRKTKKVKFSSIRFLKLLENQRIKRVRLYQILLIILRMLFIMFLVIAFSRPTLKETFFADRAGARVTAVIIIDDSYSMQSFIGANSAFDVALNSVKKILTAFNPEDQVFILTPGQQNENMSPAALNQSVQSLREQFDVTNAAPDFAPVFDRAAQIFDNYPNFNRELYLVSDFKINRHTLSDSLGQFFPEPAFRTFLVDVDEETQFKNLGIDSLIVQTQLFELNKPVNFLLKLRNYNLDEARESIVNLFLADKRLAMEHVVLEPGAVSSLEMSYIPQSTGTQLLHFELDSDDLIADNLYYGSIFIKEKINVLFVDDAPAVHLRTALKILTDNTIMQIDLTGYNHWYGKNFENYDLIVISNPRPVGTETIERLTGFLGSGKNIFIIPGDNLLPRQLNNFFEPLLSGNLYYDYHYLDNRDNYFAFGEIDKAHPVFDPVFSIKSNAADLPKVYRYWKINPRADAYLRLQNGDAFIAKMDVPDYEGNVYALASMLNLQWSDLPLKGLFVPLLYRIMYSACQSFSVRKDYLIGGSAQISLTDLSINNDFFVDPPNDEPYQIIPDQTPQGLRFDISTLPEAGPYHILKGEERMHSFAVNLSSEELKTPYLRFSNISEEVIGLNSESDFEETIKQSRRGQELWYIFLILAMLMLLAEIFLVKKIEGKSS